MKLRTKDRTKLIAHIVEMSFDYMTTVGCPPDMEGMPRDAFRALVASNDDPSLIEWGHTEGCVSWGDGWIHYDIAQFEDLVLCDVPVYSWEEVTNQFLSLQKILND